MGVTAVTVVDEMRSGTMRERREMFAWRCIVAFLTARYGR
jgi:hypothetical protein